MKKCEVMPVEKQWFTTKDAMKYLGVSRDFLDNMRQKAEIRFYVWGRTIFFNKKDIDTAIKRNKVI